MKIAIALALTAPFLAANAAHAGVFADWQMDERKDATVLRDYSGNGYTGTIGGKVVTNGRYHHFPSVQRGVVVKGRIDKVPDRDDLDPAGDPISVKVRFRWPTDRHDMNLVQKGQGSPAGGMLKVKTSVPAAGQPKGGIKCLFRGDLGDSQVQTYNVEPGYTDPGRLDDGAWHTVWCGRDVNGTWMRIDGALVDENENQPGVISNDWPITIGGNVYCPPEKGMSCNYWVGDIGFVQWTIDRPDPA